MRGPSIGLALWPSVALARSRLGAGRLFTIIEAVSGAGFIDKKTRPLTKKGKTLAHNTPLPPSVRVERGTMLCRVVRPLLRSKKNWTF